LRGAVNKEVERPEKTTRGRGVNMSQLKIPHESLAYVPKTDPTHISSDLVKAA
jgi:hypothetical protein